MVKNKKENYREIYKSYYGNIPKDEQGRKFHIHHIDGDRNNNAIDNLIAVSIKEHYDIHYRQKDWGACHRLGQLMKLPQDKLSELMSRANKSGKCGFGLGHASSAGKIGGKKFADNYKNNGKKIFDHGKDIEIIRILRSQTSKAIQSGKACSYPRQEETLYSFLNKDTGQVENLCLLDFCYKYSLDCYQVKRMIFNKINSYKGWSLSGRNFKNNSNKENKILRAENHPNYDNTEYTFVHVSGIIEKLTKLMLAKKYNLQSPNLYKIIKGTRKTHKGWSILLNDN
jgi:hypothetical protein